MLQNPSADSSQCAKTFRIYSKYKKNASAVLGIRLRHLSLPVRQIAQTFFVLSQEQKLHCG